MKEETHLRLSGMRGGGDLGEVCFHPGSEMFPGLLQVTLAENGRIGMGCLMFWLPAITPFIVIKPPDPIFK